MSVSVVWWIGSVREEHVTQLAGQLGAARIAALVKRRCSASIPPPTPSSRNPNGTYGVPGSTVTISGSENPLLPSGFFVATRPRAVMVRPGRSG